MCVCVCEGGEDAAGGGGGIGSSLKNANKVNQGQCSGSILSPAQTFTPVVIALIKNWFMLCVRISSYGCTREVWRARKKRKSCSRWSREQL